MIEYLTLEDLIMLAREHSGNDNPGIFLLSDMKTKEQADEAFSPDHVFLDENGDIILQFNAEMLIN